MCSALGYGFEYTYSVMERIRIAGLIQGDSMLNCPMVADVGFYVWKTKETQATEEEVPQWEVFMKELLCGRQLQLVPFY